MAATKKTAKKTPAAKKTAAAKKSAAKKTVKKAVKKTAPKTKKTAPKTSSKGNVKTGRTVKSLTKEKPSGNGVVLGRTYLSDSDLDFFRDLIMEQKNEILENARRLRESLIDENTGDYVGDNSTFSMHMAEQGTDEMEREKLYMFIQRDEKHLFYLENALERIAKKTYGLCISCGKSISKGRLEAVPITSHCINCKQSLSH